MYMSTLTSAVLCCHAIHQDYLCPKGRGKPLTIMSGGPSFPLTFLSRHPILNSLTSILHDILDMWCIRWANSWCYFVTVNCPGSCSFSHCCPEQDVSGQYSSLCIKNNPVCSHLLAFTITVLFGVNGDLF